MRKYIFIISMVGALVMSVGMLGAAFPAYALPQSSIASISHTDGTLPSGNTTGQVTTTINVVAPRSGNMLYLSLNTAQLPSGVHAYFSETNSSFISKNASVQSIDIPITISSSVTASGSFTLYAELDSAQDAPLSSKTDVVNVAFNIPGNTVTSQSSSFDISVHPTSLTFNASKPMPQVQTATVSIVRSSNGYTGPVSITVDQSSLQDASVVLTHVQGDTYTATVKANMAFDSLDGSVLFTAIAGSSTPEVSKSAVLDVIVKKSVQPTSKFYIADTNTLLQVGTADQLKAIYNTRYGLADVSSYATWTSSDNTVATVQAGKAVAVGQGSAIITASFAGMSDTIELSVQATSAGESSLIITSPNGGSFTAGSAISFGWRKSSGVIPLGSTYIISLKDSAGYTTLLKTGVTPLDTSFSLSLPSALIMPAGTYYLELDFRNQSGIFASVQSSAFTITSGNTTINPLTITYPQAGYILNSTGGKDSGLIAHINWTTNGNANVPTVSIDLIKASDGSAKNIASNIANTNTYAWKYDSSIPDGTYELVIYPGAESRAVGGALPSGSSSSGYFTLVKGSSTPTPTPTPTVSCALNPSTYTATVGQSVSFSFNAPNPNNYSTYAMDFLGNGSFTPTSNSLASYAYQNAGTYYPKLRLSGSIICSSMPIVVSATVISPTPTPTPMPTPVPTLAPSVTAGVFGGPSTVARGSSVTIMWTSKNITSSSAQVGISSQGVYPYIAIMQPTNGTYTWKVPESIAPGTYTIVVSVSGSGMNTISTSFPITVLSMVSQAPTFNEQMASILNSIEALLKGISF